MAKRISEEARVLAWFRLKAKTEPGTARMLFGLVKAELSEAKLFSRGEGAAKKIGHLAKKTFREAEIAVGNAVTLEEALRK